MVVEKRVRKANRIRVNNTERQFEFMNISIQLAFHHVVYSNARSHTEKCIII
jgi:hypothetical protein